MCGCEIQINTNQGAVKFHFKTIRHKNHKFNIQKSIHHISFTQKEKNNKTLTDLN